MPIHEGEPSDRSGLASVTVDGSQYGKLYVCRSCSVWYVTVERTEGGMLIREWHEETCPSLRADDTE